MMRFGRGAPGKCGRIGCAGGGTALFFGKYTVAYVIIYDDIQQCMRIYYTNVVQYITIYHRWLVFMGGGLGFGIMARVLVPGLGVGFSASRSMSPNPWNYNQVIEHEYHSCSTPALQE